MSTNVTTPQASSSDTVIAVTRNWLERAVIGLNLCPFAKAVYVKGQVRYVVSGAESAEALLDDLERELALLVSASADKVDTTLLIHPHVLMDFADFVAFLDLVEVVLATHRLTGVLQVASFHPDYVFADAESDDPANCTNRSPYPMLHLLREGSLARAVDAYPDVAAIYERNIETLRKLGLAGWKALGVGAPGRED